MKSQRISAHYVERTKPPHPQSMHIPIKSQQHFPHRNKHFALEALTKFSQQLLMIVCFLHLIK